MSGWASHIEPTRGTRHDKYRGPAPASQVGGTDRPAGRRYAVASRCTHEARWRWGLSRQLASPRAALPDNRRSPSPAGRMGKESTERYHA